MFSSRLIISCRSSFPFLFPYPAHFTRGIEGRGERANLLNLRSRVFENIQAAFDPIRHIDQSVGIDVEIVEHRRLLSFGRRWNKEADFLGAKLVSDIEDAQAGVVISDENDVLALKRAGRISCTLCGPKRKPRLQKSPSGTGQELTITGLRSSRISMIQTRFSPSAQSYFTDSSTATTNFLPGSGKRRMRIAAERRAPIDVADGFRFADFGNVEDRHAGVDQRDVRTVALRDRAMHVKMLAFKRCPIRPASLRLLWCRESTSAPLLSDLSDWKCRRSGTRAL